jgi:hypothetical protein
MTQPALEIELKGLDELERAMKKFPRTVAKNLGAAGKESAEDIILPTEGLRNYPPETAANKPPTPYYIRGVGTQTQSSNYLNSERLGTRWNVTRRGHETRVSNPASYARYLHGEEQAGAMADIGWVKLWDTAKKKVKQITKVYQAWVAKTLKDVGLK